MGRFGSQYRVSFDSINNHTYMRLRDADYSDTNYDQRFSLGAISSLRSQIGTICRWSGTTVEDRVVPKQKWPSQRSAPAQIRRRRLVLRCDCNKISKVI